MFNVASRSVPSRWRAACLLTLAVLCLVAILFWSPIQAGLILRLVLRSDAPDESAVQDLVRRASDPVAILKGLWETGKIPHRHMAMNYVKNKAGSDLELLARAESIVFKAAGDVDLSVRELALGALAAQNHARLAELAGEQLFDADPQARALGLRYLRKHKDPVLVPTFIRLLDDPDRSVTTTADAALRWWTGEDFGIRLAMGVSSLDANATEKVNTEADAKLAEGVRRWKEWWQKHQAEYPHATNSSPETRPSPSRLPVADFELTDPSGKLVTLSGFRGKVVLLNFWTTWCTACLIEIPNLVELQRRDSERVVILGISLDGLPEDDGHGHVELDAHDHGGRDLSKVKDTVAEFAKSKGINYRVLLDPTAEVGRRFNGNELPTNVLIDGAGYVRRRFLGGRSVAVFEAMIRELEPAASVSK